MGLFNKLFDKKANEPFIPSDEAVAIMDRLGCPCEVIESGRLTSAQVMALYRDALADGRREGFVPLIIIPSDTLLETLDLHGDDCHSQGLNTVEARQKIIEQADRADAEVILRERYREAMDFGDDSALRESDVIGEIAEGNPLHEFISLKAYGGGDGLCPECILAKIPAANSCQLPAWVPMGGFNDCPHPHEQVAIFRYWNLSFGAHPAVVGYDTWECFVERPPADDKAAMALALEQMAYAPDIVFQGIESIGALADSLRDTPVWFFWWD